MAKQFKDFTFGKNKLSDIFKFVSADFDGNSDVPLAMDRKKVKQIDIELKQTTMVIHGLTLCKSNWIL